MNQLSAADMEVLEFERSTWKHGGQKATEVRERFGCSLTRYFQRLNQIIDLPAAEVFDPAHVRRLRRLRDARRVHRDPNRKG